MSTARLQTDVRVSEQVLRPGNTNCAGCGMSHRACSGWARAWAT